MVEETEIYLRLIDGTQVFAPVKARQIKDELFLITKNDNWDDEDFSSIWEFFPGDIVRVIKKDGYLIADSLIDYSKSTSERKLRELLFLIVFSMGEISIEKLVNMKVEIMTLCNEETLSQQKHPIIKSWIVKNCDNFSNRI